MREEGVGKMGTPVPVDWRSGIIQSRRQLLGMCQHTPTAFKIRSLSLHLRKTHFLLHARDSSDIEFLTFCMSRQRLFDKAKCISVFADNRNHAKILSDSKFCITASGEISWEQMFNLRLHSTLARVMLTEFSTLGHVTILHAWQICRFCDIKARDGIEFVQELWCYWTQRFHQINACFNSGT